jgi:predicted RNase H-related nuclease YkuK (DUF458 family)
MRWRKFNGDPIEAPIIQAVEQAIKRETAAGFRLKVCIGTDSQVKGQETEFATVIVFRGKVMAALCSSTMKRPVSNSLSKSVC